MTRWLTRCERRLPLLIAAGGAWAALALPTLEAEAKGKTCPAGMVLAGDACIDMYEGSLVDVDEKGKLTPHPHYEPVGDNHVRAVSKKGVFPQGYISRNEAEAACKDAKKRLCTDDEWLTACRGKKATKFPYGEDRKDAYCNDHGLSPLNKFFGDKPDGEKYGASAMNDPRLNQMAGGLAKTGSHAKCKNAFRVYDMVGNLHEWTADSGGTFRGGYYLDTKINGEGCDYKTTAHNSTYHDYSTGFRCCK